MMTRLLLGNYYCKQVAHRRSSDSLARLRRIHPAGKRAVFRAARELFGFGHRLQEAGAEEAALELYRETINTLEGFVEEEQSPFTTGAVAECALEHGVKLYYLGKIDQARGCFREAVRYYESLIASDVAAPVIEQLSLSVLWLAVSQRQTRDIEAACRNYLRAISLYRQLIAFLPGNKKEKQYFGYIRQAIIGYRKARTLLGAPQKPIN